jgi:hypothetical protein
MTQTLPLVIKPEKQRSNFVALRRVAKAADHAIRSAQFLDLERAPGRSPDS